MCRHRACWRAAAQALGHQRAIATGLCYAHDHLPAHVVVVMDGDGEDAPQDVPRLLDQVRATDGRKIVFAERTKRSESVVFRGATPCTGGRTSY